MSALIDFIVKNLLAFWPIARVSEWQVAMLVRNGRILRSLGPGLHWRWLFIDQVEKWPGTVQALDLATGAVMYQGKSYAISGNMMFRCIDLPTLWRSLWDSSTTLRLIAIGILCDVLTERGVGVSREDIADEALERMRAEFDSKGVEVVAFRITELTEVRGHRHFVEGALAR